MLFLDGHKSHMSFSLSEFCDANGIILYALPPNTTHMLQPADVNVFKPLKQEWKSTVRSWLSLPENENSCVNKLNFCNLFKKSLEGTNTTSHIRQGFRKCGLFPLDPESVDYSKCVRNTLENKLQKPISQSVGSVDTTDTSESDLKSAIKVLNKIEGTLYDYGINVQVIYNEINQLRPKQGIPVGAIIPLDALTIHPIQDIIIHNSDDPEEVGEIINSTQNDDLLEEPVFQNFENYEVTEQGQIIINNIKSNNNNDIITDCDVTEKPYEVEENDELQRMDNPRLLEQKEQLISESEESNMPSQSRLASESPEDLSKEIVPKVDKTEKSVPKEDKTEENRNKILDQESVPKEDKTEENKDKIIDQESVPKEDKTEENRDKTIFQESVPPQTHFSDLGTPSENITDPFENHLRFPEPIQKSQNKAPKEKLPNAISSQAWRDCYTNKERQKTEKLEQIKLRKEQRAANKKQKEIKKKVVKKGIKRPRSGKENSLKPTDETSSKSLTTKERIKCTLCEEDLISDAEDDLEKNIGCDYCYSWYHLKCSSLSELRYEVAAVKDYKCDLCM